MESFEPQHDKTNKMTVRPAKLKSAWASAQSDQSLSCALNQWVAKDPSFFHADSKDSDQTGRMDTQADLRLRWAHMLFCWFCRVVAYLYPLRFIETNQETLFRTTGICKQKAKKPKVSKRLIPSRTQCKHFFQHQCRKPSIFKSRRSLAVLRPGQLILLFQNSHGLTGILHSIVSGFSGLVVRS